MTCLPFCLLNHCKSSERLVRRRSSDLIFALARPEQSRAQALSYHARAWLCPWTTPWNAMDLDLGSVFVRLSPCSFPGTRWTGNKTFLTAREVMTTGKTSQIMIKNKISEYLVLLKATRDTGVAVLWSHQDSLPGVQTCPRPSPEVQTEMFVSTPNIPCDVIAHDLFPHTSARNFRLAAELYWLSTTCG